MGGGRRDGRWYIVVDDGQTRLRIGVTAEGREGEGGGLERNSSNSSCKTR